MGIYIPGMELPPDVEGCEIIIRIQPDGTVLNAGKIHLGMKATELPPHGRLGDLDALTTDIQEMIESFDRDFPFLNFNSRYMMEKGMRMAIVRIEGADTIIPADPKVGADG